MKPPHRRRFLHLVAGAAALPAVSPVARAQAYPTRPVRVIVGVSAGDSVDMLTRLMASWLSERLGQQFIIENRPGAGGYVGAEAVVKSAPDGYTLLSVGPNYAINATLHDKLNFNFIRDIVPIASVSRGPNVMVVELSVPAKTVPHFIAYAKANRGSPKRAPRAKGPPPNVAGDLLKRMTGVNMVHVPYRGGAPALTDLLAGQMQVMSPATAASIEYIRTGKLRALAVTTATRLE